MRVTPTDDAISASATTSMTSSLHDVGGGRPRGYGDAAGHLRRAWRSALRSVARGTAWQQQRIDDYLLTWARLRARGYPFTTSRRFRPMPKTRVGLQRDGTPPLQKHSPPAPHRRDVSYLPFFSVLCPAFCPGLSRARYDRLAPVLQRPMPKRGEDEVPPPRESRAVERAQEKCSRCVLGARCGKGARTRYPESLDETT
jgi:hypothetical protein